MGEGRGSAVELATQGSQVGKKARLNTQHRGHWGKKARLNRRHKGHWGKKSAIEQVTREVLAKTSKQTNKQSYLFPPPPPIYVYIFFPSRLHIVSFLAHERKAEKVIYFKGLASESRLAEIAV